MKKVTTKSNPLKVFNDNNAKARMKAGGAMKEFKKSLPKAQYAGQTPASSTYVNNPYKNNFPDLKSNTRTTSPRAGVTVTNVTEPYTNKRVSRTVNSPEGVGVIKKEKGSTLSNTSTPYGTGYKQKYVTDTTGYSAGKKEFPTVHTWEVKGGMGDARNKNYEQTKYKSDRPLTKEEVDKIYQLKKKGGSVKSKKK